VSDRSRQADFPQTRWTIVIEAQRTGDARAQVAFADLCGQYWYPLYAFARRSGHGPEDAEDLTQLFFQRLMEREILEKADRERGRLRSFLLATFKRVQSEEYRRENREKRGGQAQIVSIEGTEGEERYTLEPVSAELTPEQAWERSWAVALLDGVLDDLAAAYSAKGKQEQFEMLKEHLAWNATEVSLAETAAALGMSEVSLRVTIHRLRKRYRDCLEERIAATVSSVDEIDDELNHLLAVFRR
jgi:RNA polymerase sigma-70 factor (ECF subfamily)